MQRKKASRIPASVWDHYREEITELFRGQQGTLQKTRDTMEKRHGFQATPNQYETRLRAWGVSKYANTNIYLYIDYILRKRKSEGKEIKFIIHGVSKSQSQIAKEIARHVTHKNRLKLWEDVFIPEGLQVITSEVDPEHTADPVAYPRYLGVTNSVVEVEHLPDPVGSSRWYLKDFPCLRLQENICTIISYMIERELQIFKTLDQPDSQRNALNSPQTAAKLLEIVLGETAELIDTKKNLLKLHFRSKDETGRYARIISLASYFTRSEEVLPPFIFNSFEMPGGCQHAALETLMQYFIVLTNNDVLGQSQIFTGVKWLLHTIQEIFFCKLFCLATTTVRIFLNKIFLAVVNSGNTAIVKLILNQGIDLTGRRSPFTQNITREQCMAVAVVNNDNQMVTLLCKANFPPVVDNTYLEKNQNRIPWNKGNYNTLQTLLSFGAHPEFLLADEKRGSLLLNTARQGSIELVDLLLKEGSNINIYIPSCLGTPLQAAVWAENLEMVEFLIGRGADINAPYGEKYMLQLHDLDNIFNCSSLRTPIEIACKSDNTALIDLLLDHGARPDFIPLAEININDHEGLMRDNQNKSLDYSPNYKEVRFHTALQYSVQNRNTSVVRRLLSEKVGPDSRVLSKWGDTPLQISIRIDCPEITKQLINSGARVNAPPGMLNGRTAIQAAAERGDVEKVKILLCRNADINALPSYERGLTALQAAIKNGHGMMAGFLLAFGAKLNTPPAEIEGLTPLQAAAAAGDLNLMKSLIHYGASANEAELDKAIISAISNKNLEMVEILARYGAEKYSCKEGDYIGIIGALAKSKWVEGTLHFLSNRTCFRFTHDAYKGAITGALYWSIVNHDFEMIKLLLGKGDQHIDVTELCKNALSHALCKRCPSEVIHFILDEYRKFFVEMPRGSLTMAVVYSVDETTVIEKMLASFWSGPGCLYLYEELTNAWVRLSGSFLRMRTDVSIKIIELLLAAGAPIDYQDNQASFLQQALKFRRTTVAKYLIENGANINVPATDMVGTPLQEAIKSHETEISYQLLNLGSDLNAPPAPKSGRTALQAAAQTGDINLVTELLDRGANVNAPPSPIYGVTALGAAASKGYINVAMELLRRGADVFASPTNQWGKGIIDNAAEKGYEEMLHLLLRHCHSMKKEDLSVICMKAADAAASEGHLEITSWLRAYITM